jgi:hypothetical protein
LKRRYTMRAQDVYTQARNAARKIVEANNELQALSIEWNALDYGTTLPPGEGENAGLVSGQIGNVIFGTQAAIQGLLNAGHATNLYTII